MTLIKTSILTAISTIIKILSGFIINKTVAIYVGPAGIALIGQLQNFVLIMSNLSNGAISNGVVKYTAEYKIIGQKQSLFSTSLKISIFMGLLTSFLLAIFANYIALKLLGDMQYISVIYLLSGTIIFYSLNVLLMSILNGQKEIKKYVISNIANSIFSLVLITILTIYIGLKGALYALVINQSLAFFVTLFFIVKSDWFCLEYFQMKFDIKIAQKLSHFSLMAVTSVIFSIGSILFIRSYISTNISLVDAGYWQGIIYISDAYLLIVAMSLKVYYLPRLSEIDNNKELLSEILSGYKIILPIVIIMALIIFLLKIFIINALFTEEFHPMIELFKWQLIGDVFKISSWLLSYVILAKSMTKVFVYTEIIFTTLFVVLSILFMEYFGLIGVTYAYSLNYIFYLLTMIFIYRRNFK